MKEDIGLKIKFEDPTINKYSTLNMSDQSHPLVVLEDEGGQYLIVALCTSFGSKSLKEKNIDPKFFRLYVSVAGGQAPEQGQPKLIMRYGKGSERFPKPTYIEATGFYKVDKNLGTSSFQNVSRGQYSRKISTQPLDIDTSILSSRTSFLTQQMSNS